MTTPLLRTLRVLALFAAVTGSGCATLKLNLQSVELLEAYEDLKDNRLDAALARIGRVEAKSDLPPEVVSEAAYLKARVLEAQQRLPEAIVQYRTVVAIHPNTPDGYLARKRLEALGPGPAAP